MKRVDGSEADFSWPVCLDGRPSRKTQVMNAFRHEVWRDVATAKADFFACRASVVCEATGRSITIDDSHLDHMAPLTFEVLVYTFLKLKDLTTDSIDIENEDEGIGVWLRDRDLAREWRDYHARAAVARPVAKEYNLSSARANKLKPPVNKIEIKVVNK